MPTSVIILMPTSVIILMHSAISLSLNCSIIIRSLFLIKLSLSLSPSIVASSLCPSIVGLRAQDLSEALVKTAIEVLFKPLDGRTQVMKLSLQFEQLVL